MKQLLWLALSVIIVFPVQASEPKHGLALYGQLKYPKDFAQFDYVNSQAPMGGTLKRAAIGTFDSVNPYILKGIPAAELGLIYDTLLTSSHDEPFSKYGLIAESVEVADTNQSVTFTLRQEAVWHDGSPITSDDIIFSYERIINDGHPFYRAYYKDVAKVEALSPKEVRFIFTTTDNKELAFILGEFPIISKAYYTQHPFNQSSITPPLGNGPYKITSVDPGHNITYERVANYWANDLNVNRGRYNFAKISIDYYRDAAVAIEALKAGAYHLRQENISKNWFTAYEIDQVRNKKLIKDAIPHQIPTGMQGFVFNTRLTKFADVKTREALTYAFDFEWTNAKLFYNAYQRTLSYFSNSPFASSGLPSTEELAILSPYKDILPERLFTEAFTLPVTKGNGNSRLSLLNAKKLLEEAGWILEDNQLIHPTTKESFTIEFLLVSPSFERVIAPMLHNLKKLGIQASMRTVDSAQYEKRLNQFDFDIMVYVFGQSLAPGNEQMNYWHSTRAAIEGSKNFAAVRHPVVDRLVEQIIAADSKEALITTTKALDRVLLWNFYVIPNWYINQHRLVYWDIFKRPAIQPSYDVGVYNWWIDKEKFQEISQTYF